MARLPNPKSYEQIVGDMLATYISKIGVNDLNVGSAVTSFFEAMAQAVYRASGDTFSILRDFSVDRAEGEALQRIAEEERVFPIPARVATGRVTISDTSFTKISTKIYAGTPPPNIGSITINVSDASEFPATGSIYIGRATPNIEGPIPYSSIVNLGGFFQINLSTPTTKYHNNSETVILAQGGVRNVPVGTGVRTVGGGSSPQIAFSTTQLATILDGETEITNVPVAAQEPGIEGNVPRNAITQFISSPFTGAAVTNPNPFTTGRNEESDEEIRIRIKRQRVSRGLGTAIAIESAVQGIRANDENATVTSNQILSTGDRTTLFIDNGQGYEALTRGVGLEFIVDSALGGEQFFQLSTGGRQTSIAKAFLQGANTAPFNINPNDRLAVLVGGVLSEHVFSEGDFASNGTASAFEVVASINANSNLAFSARTVENGTKITLSAKEENNEFIQKTTPTVGGDAGVALGLPSNEVETLKLFKNKVALSRNGRAALIESENQTDWSNTITNGETLIISVDGTQEITYTIDNADFAAEGTHSTVAQTNTLQSWVNVLNAKITGITASINGNRIVLQSNLGTSSRAGISVNVASTLVSKGVFTQSNGLVSNGREADFTLSRNTAQVKLTAPLQKGDSLTAGSDATQGRIETEQILGGNVTLPSNAEMWFLIDNPGATIINNGVLSDSEITITKQPANVIRFRSALAGAFSNVQPGDYVVLWSQEVLPVNRFEGRVHAVGTDQNPNDYFEIKLTVSEYNLATAQGPVTYLEGLSFLRSEVPPQKILINANSYQISEVADIIESQLLGVSVTTENDEFIIVSTKNKSVGGSVLLFTQNDSAKNLNFEVGSLGNSQSSLIGFNVGDLAATEFPLFFHSSFTTDRSALPPSTYINQYDSAIDLDTAGIDPDGLVAIQHPYLSNGSYILDAQAADERVLIDNINGTAIDPDSSETIRRIRVNDRFYLLKTLDIGFNDTVTVVLDNDATNKTFPISLFRRAVTNPTMPINSDQFRAYDVDGGPTAEFLQFFGSSFSFKNYKAIMKAKNVIDPSGSVDEDSVLYRSAVWGRAGEKYRVGYFYPTAPDQSISSSVLVGENVDVRISLNSGPAVVNNIDGTTEWNVTITPNTPTTGVDEVTYSWSSVGSNPTMTTLAPGDYVSINTNGEFSSENTGTYRISSANSTSFTVRKPSGSAVTESNIATLTNTTISLYEDSDTTAEEIVTYVTDNLSEYVTAELLEDNGIAGAGVISKSTHEDNNFAAGSEYVVLVDALNWIEASTLSAAAPSSQFEFKRPLLLSSFDTNTTGAYSFNDGEEIRLVPTSIKQVSEFISVLAVSGITTLGEVSTSNRERQLQISTNVLGSSGAVLVSGGTGNNAEGSILGVAQRLSGTDFIRATIPKSSVSGFAGGGFVTLEATNKQRKITGISFTTQATITPNSPTATQSVVSFSNRDITDRYFGEARNNPRLRGRAFHVEKQGSFVCISWDGITGSDPLFSKTVSTSDSGGGNVAVAFNGDFNATEYTTSGFRRFTEVQPGDIMTVTGFTNAANNGVFTVLGVSDNKLTVSVNNAQGVTETALIAAGDLSFTTEIKEGDTVEIGAPFANLNQGIFRVIRRFNNSIYIENKSAVEERVVVGDNLRDLGFDATTQFEVTTPGPMRISWNTNGTQPTLGNAKMGDIVTVGTAFASINQGTFMVEASGDNFIDLKNASAGAQSGITVSGVGGDVLEAQIPAMKFSEYEATVPGDSFVISGNVLDVNNQGTYGVVEVLSKNSIVVDDILTAQTGVPLNDLFVQVYVEEGRAYTGVKRIHTFATNPANNLQSNIIFDTAGQVEKINQAAGITVSAASKLEFPEVTVTGFDSYKYHTGLLGEANRVVYGDPRDTVTYPGVAAAGAEIFIDPPLQKRIQVSINVRVNTGVPFSRVTEEVRNAIAALINSSPLGESIAISDIISSVNSIPGVRAVSISSPAYDPTNDVIVVNPAEKPSVIDIVNDITVSKTT